MYVQSIAGGRCEIPIVQYPAPKTAWLGGGTVCRRLVRAVRLSREPLEMGDTLAGNWFQHEFTEAEIRGELEQAGFRVEYFSGRFGGHAVGVAVE